MRTNIEIDDALMAEVMETFGVKTKREAVERAMREAVRIKRQLQALDGLRGIGWDGDLDDMRTSKYIPAGWSSSSIPACGSICPPIGQRVKPWRCAISPHKADVFGSAT
ncbi:Arc/MetJ family transcription regulator [Sphingomonas insulae]|uniref:Type II toxin-antitoxin system VapB family antitoxin n=1 Tax=Sphingomonas insulae TaxID=424800 RepID=A0ABP3T2G3_9SPHN|nr:type II toxin-antitoxin system VapB family antitoxin [Sphingomonas insulae]NIJ28194.1 Arc/MetJ family transcription regulator [Sphingomonas insulae]